MIKILFAATPEIAVNSIKKLASFSDIKIEGIITMPDRPSGRGQKLVPPPVKIFAEKNGMKVFQTPSVSKDRELIEIIKSLNPDFIVTFAFGQILSQEVIDIPKYGIINLHASLLPKYRGANPMAAAIAAGEKETGITTMRTVLKPDAGDICLQEKIPLTEDMNLDDLTNKVSEKAPYLIYKTLKMIISGQMNFIKQNEDEATFAPKFQKEDFCLNFDMPADEFHNKVKAMVDKAYVTVCGKKVKITETCRCDKGFQNCECSTIADFDKESIVVMCKDKPVVIKKVKPESKGVICAKDWINGIRLKKGEMLCPKEP